MAIKNPGHKHGGFNAEEIVSGLMHIASNDKNKETIVDEGILPMITKLLQEGMSHCLSRGERYQTAMTIRRHATCGCFTRLVTRRYRHAVLCLLCQRSAKRSRL